MRNVVQITAQVLHMSVELWCDVMEIPAGSVNDIAGLLASAQKDFPGRKVRIIQILEEPKQED